MAAGEHSVCPCISRLAPRPERAAIGCESHSQCYARGHCSPLRPTFPPLRTPHGFACSVASLSRCPCHYRPGRCNFRRAALVERPLGQGKPSTRSAGRNADCCAPATTPHLGDRKALLLPGERELRSDGLRPRATMSARRLLATSSARHASKRRAVTCAQVATARSTQQGGGSGNGLLH